MDNRNKLKNALQKLNSDSGLGSAFKSVEDEMKRIATKVKREADSQATEFTKKNLKEVKDELKGDIDGLENAFKDLQKELDKTEQTLNVTIQEKVSSLQQTSAQLRDADGQKMVSLANQIDILRDDIKQLNQQKIKIPEFSKDFQRLEAELRQTVTNFQLSQPKEKPQDWQKKIDQVSKDISDLRNRTLANLGHAGQANRQINVNSSLMSFKYTDINFQQGGNIGWNVSNDDVYKRVNISASILSGGGGGSGNPASPDKSVQFNAGGSFGGSQDFVWDDVEKKLVITNFVGDGSTDFFGSGILGHFEGSALSISGADATTTDVNGTGFSLGSGNGNGNAEGGPVDIFAGGGGLTSGKGADIRVIAGPARGGDSNGGNIAIQAGSPFGAGNTGYVAISDDDGNAFLVGGVAAGLTSNLPAVVNELSPNPAFLNTSILTVARTFQFPDKDGTFAMLSDIGSGGIVRSVNNIAGNTNAGSTAGTDYVYLAAGTITVTMPTAVGNTNRYTIKNVGAGTVTIAAQAGENIETDPTLLLPLQFTSVDLISNSAVWLII